MYPDRDNVRLISSEQNTSDTKRIDRILLYFTHQYLIYFFFVPWNSSLSKLLYYNNLKNNDKWCVWWQKTINYKFIIYNWSKNYKDNFSIGIASTKYIL